MLVYHTGRTKYAGDLTGKGAEINGGRWNNIGIPCIYTSVTKALSILEYTANVNANKLPGSLSITEYDIPDDCWKAIEATALPANWQQRPFPKETAALGSSLLLKKEFLAIKIPSVIVPDEFNYILNPLHVAFNKVKIKKTSKWLFDMRIKQ